LGLPPIAIAATTAAAIATAAVAASTTMVAPAPTITATTMVAATAVTATVTAAVVTLATAFFVLVGLPRLSTRTDRLWRHVDGHFGPVVVEPVEVEVLGRNTGLGMDCDRHAAEVFPLDQFTPFLVQQMGGDVWVHMHIDLAN
jgi:hypothetical protein